MKIINLTNIQTQLAATDQKDGNTMRTIRTKVYQFSELSKKAQETAVENNACNAEYFWSDDAIKSLEKFAKHFGAKLQNYEIDWTGSYSYSFARFDTEDINLTEDELKERIKAMGSYNKKTLRGDGDCKFTGYSMDEDAADGARKEYFKGERDIEKILQAGFDTWLKAGKADYECQLSHEQYAEHCEANEYEFKADGTRF